MLNTNSHAEGSNDYAKLGHPVLVQRCETLSRQNQKIREANQQLTQHIEQAEARNQQLESYCQTLLNRLNTEQRAAR